MVEIALAVVVLVQFALVGWAVRKSLRRVNQRMGELRLALDKLRSDVIDGTLGTYEDPEIAKMAERFGDSVDTETAMSHFTEPECPEQ